MPKLLVNKAFAHSLISCSLPFNTKQPNETTTLSIYEIYLAPLQGNYSEALPAQAWVKIKVLSL